MKKLLCIFCIGLLALTAKAERPLTEPGHIEDIAGIPGKRGYAGDGRDAAVARFANPLGMAIDTLHNIYIADTMNHRVRRIRNRNGYIETIAGTGKPGNGNDGGHADMAQLHAPTALAFDRYGSLFIADTGNHAIRMMTRDGYLYTVAGNGLKGFNGDGSKGKATSLNSPAGVAFNNAGELYFADTGNHRIRKIDGKTGNVITVAGTGDAGNSGDYGPALNARLNGPTGIVFDKYDNLFIADTKNHQIRFVDSRSGRIFTLAGSGRRGYSGDDSSRSGDARFNHPTAMAIDRLGRIYVADTDNQRVRRIKIDLENRRGSVETVVGSGKRGYNGDDINAWDAQLAYPGSLVISPRDILYFLDTGNNIVRRVQGISRLRPPTSYTSFGTAAPSQETDSRSFYEVLFKPQQEEKKKK